MPMGVNQGSIDSVIQRHYIIVFGAEVVEWQTRTFEGRVGKPVRVQIPPSAPIKTPLIQDFAATEAAGAPIPMSDWALTLNAVAAGVVVAFGFTMAWNPIPVSWAVLAGLGFVALLVWLGTTPKHVWAWACLFLGLESLSWPAVPMIKLQMSGVTEPNEDQMKELVGTSF